MTLLPLDSFRLADHHRQSAQRFRFIVSSDIHIKHQNEKLLYFVFSFSLVRSLSQTSTSKPGERKTTWCVSVMDHLLLSSVQIDNDYHRYNFVILQRSG